MHSANLQASHRWRRAATTRPSEPSLAVAIEQLCKRTRDGWAANPDQIEKDSREEENLLFGGYGNRQVLELVQNAVDAALGRESARCELRIVGNRLYAANEGAPLDGLGARALIMGQLSSKRGNEIGRFGLGFRSLLKFAGVVDFMSGGVVMRFDPERCAAEARHAGGLADHAPAPGFRLVQLRDPDVEILSDPVLNSMAWADTIVRMELGSQSAVEMVVAAFADFPSSFVLFTDVAMRLEMSVNGHVVRSISRTKQATEVDVLDGDEAAKWQVFTKHAVIDDIAALADAGSVHARGAVSVTWAVRVDAAEPQAGELWVYFPTRTPCGLPGILNAQWKVNSDRTGLTGHEWNAAIMRVAADLVAESLCSMAASGAAGLALSLFPALPDRADSVYTELAMELWRQLPELAVFSDATGTAKEALFLARPPFDDAPAYERWVEVVGADIRSWMVHPASISSPHRQAFLNQTAQLLQSDAFMRARNRRDTAASAEILDFLMSMRAARGGVDIEDDATQVLSELEDGDEPSLSRVSLSDWLTSAATREAAKFGQLLDIGATIARRFKSVRASLQDIPFVPASDGKLRPGASLVLLADGSDTLAMNAVDPCLLEESRTVKLLTDFYGVRRLTPELWIPLLSAQWKDARWRPEMLWGYHVQLAAAAPDVRAAFLQKHRSDVLLKTAAGQWRNYEQVLLPGRIIKGHNLDNAVALCVDPEFQKTFAETIKLLEIEDIPAACEIETSRTALDEARNGLYEYYVAQASAKSKPQQQTLGFVIGGRRPLAGAALLETLKGESGARLTERVLKQISENVPIVTEMGPDASGLTNARYRRVRVPDPSTYLVLAHGKLMVGDACIWAETVLALSRRLGSASRSVLGPLHDVIRPIDERVPSEYEFQIPDMQACWDAIAISSGRRTAAQRLALWEAGAAIQLVPRALPLGPKHEAVALQVVWVTRDERVASLVERSGKPSQVLGPLAFDLWRQRGAAPVEWLLSYAVTGTRSERVPLAELIPSIGEHLRHAESESVLADSIEERFGDTVQDADAAFDGTALLVRREWWKSADRVSATRRIVELASLAGWLKGSVSEVFASVSRGSQAMRRLHVAKELELSTKLLRAVGGKIAPLRDALPVGARDMVPERASGKVVAQLVLDVLGSSSLRALSATLSAEDLAPPKVWGTAEATDFVRALGFPDAFAGAGNPVPALEVFVDGPPVLGELHPYQVGALDEVLEVLESQADRRRLVLSLPTGAGKTRVAVEAVIRSLKAGHGRSGPTIWLAQTQELAEQAVAAFRVVWRAVGPPDTELRVIQFWGSVSNPTEPRQETPTVVVSLVQTLERRMSDPELKWLRTPRCLVIDESHHAIAPVYTQILEFFGFTVGNRKAGTPPEPSLLGLSATPFRSAGAVESQRLASRFDNRVTPSNQSELFAQLQADGFLSEVVLEEVDSEEELSLTTEELELAERFGELPESAIERLADNVNRNERIVRLIKQAHERSILLFAATVVHAERLATFLSLADIRSRVVSGATDRSARQHAIESFRDGDVRVLCNAQVLTTGFDAPKVDLIVIARPVFSPVRYMQMVGRGMRGPRNGGTTSCRVLTITDVVQGFSAFNSVEWWRQYYA